jgi:hypothetical protein
MILLLAIRTLLDLKLQSDFKSSVNLCPVTYFPAWTLQNMFNITLKIVNLKRWKKIKLDLLLNTADEETEQWVAMTRIRTVKPRWRDGDLLDVSIFSCCLRFYCLSFFHTCCIWPYDLYKDDVLTVRRCLSLQSFI